MSWTDERVELLKKLWQDGHSASQIAKQLGAVTRNAVIGKVHRLGLSGRAAPSQPTRPVFKPVRPVRIAAEPVATPPTQLRKLDARAVVTVAQAQNQSVPQITPHAHLSDVTELVGTATVMTLGSRMCKWPIGDPMSENFSFCGRRVDDGSPYCSEHARLAYQPSMKKKREQGQDVSRQMRRYL